MRSTRDCVSTATSASESSTVAKLTPQSGNSFNHRSKQPLSPAPQRPPQRRACFHQKPSLRKYRSQRSHLAGPFPPPRPKVIPCRPRSTLPALKLIRDEIGDCTRCQLSQGRNKIVFGDGDPNAKLFFVGEGPGADEDAQGLPFVGRGGQLLNNMIAAMGLKREQVYIANIVRVQASPEPHT